MQITTPKIEKKFTLSEELVEREKIGTKRSIKQIQYTISFELKRNLKKFYSSLLIVFTIFLLSYIINAFQFAQGVSLPEEITDYITSYLGFIDLLIIIIASTFGGSIIAEDFEKDSGNLLFPKIPRNRLLVGRLISRYFLAALSIMFFYGIIGFISQMEYDAVIPIVMWESMGWALLYLFAVLSFVTFLSSVLNKTATTVVTSILLLLMVFNIVSTIMMFTGLDVEPLFLLTYYSNIITSWFNMPEQRLTHIERFGNGPNTVEVSFYSWSTPSAEGALIGMILYSILLLTGAYFLYKRKQKK